MRLSPILNGLLLTLLLAGCQTSPQAEDALYHDLGEREGIAQITEGLLYQIVDDPRIAHQFKGVDIAELHYSLTNFICQRAGGPCEYEGENMVTVHQDMDLTTADFNALVEDLIRAMEKQDVPVGTQNALLARLAPLHGMIVERREEYGLGDGI
ncbi:group 1 truncated hemoglobin [Marinobacteraceae bacterium S3BR75-40.1]